MRYPRKEIKNNAEKEESLLRRTYYTVVLKTKKGFHANKRSLNPIPCLEKEHFHTICYITVILCNHRFDTFTKQRYLNPNRDVFIWFREQTDLLQKSDSETHSMTYTVAERRNPTLFRFFQQIISSFQSHRPNAFKKCLNLHIGRRNIIISDIERTLLNNIRAFRLNNSRKLINRL